MSQSLRHASSRPMNTVAFTSLMLINGVEEQVLEMIRNENNDYGQLETLNCLFHSMKSNYSSIEWSWDNYSDAGKLMFGIAGCNCDIYYDPEANIPIEHELCYRDMANEFDLPPEDTSFMLGNIHGLFIAMNILLTPAELL